MGKAAVRRNAFGGFFKIVTSDARSQRGFALKVSSVKAVKAKKSHANSNMTLSGIRLAFGDGAYISNSISQDPS